MRATALLQLRLPHPTDTEPRDVKPSRRPRRHGRKAANAAHPAALHIVAPTARHDPTTDLRSTGSQIVARVRNAGGPIDNASYTCACGFVFAASVSTTVRCPHCGAAQAW
jgi:hypothetical protein